MFTLRSVPKYVLNTLSSHWHRFRNFRLQSCVIKQMTVQSMRSERGLNTIPHCLQWYKFVLCTPLCTAAEI